ncbi:hypothetical protein BJH93_07120 [Kocuria polaris]|nr:hypothetical protein [Kocuria polaris]
MAKIDDVATYLADFDGTALTMLTDLRALCRDDSVGAVEDVRWNQPAYIHSSGTILFTFSGHTTHANMVFTPSTLEAFGEELADQKTGKGSLRLPYDEPLPVDLLTRMIRYRIDEHEQEGVLWK